MREVLSLFYEEIDVRDELRFPDRQGYVMGSG